ncbi:LysR family transcriptional regulator [Thioalkalivibrio sp. XN8]|uniref:LysR family transcriptional regulator n=1 Tax=Thioalkalivibrio sp. XN8 TaxID=2712863 RepID=UPI0013E9E4F9|nr:LysR family transcriptional regulator [Thioalkalivibrio sp. XN8]NGP52860.1 LysR family transcriptional regulator [Thioalkalivibrio sp. XN8]
MRPRVTLEQWRMLQAVVDHDGYAGAAEALSKSVSTVSYGIRRLEAGLGVALLEMQGRRAVLTTAGRELLRRSRYLLDEALAIERAAGMLAKGWEPVVRLAVEVIFPQERLLASLDAFASVTGTTRVELIESVLSGTNEQLVAGKADLAITAMVPQGFLGEPLTTVEFIAVAHPEHPLHALSRPLTQRDLRQHRQLVVRDSGLREPRDAGWLGAEQRWTVSHLATSVEAVARGMGFAWLPRHRIAGLLADGQLQPLPLAEGALRHVELYLVFADREDAGPAARALADCLRRSCPAD